MWCLWEIKWSFWFSARCFWIYDCHRWKKRRQAEVIDGSGESAAMPFKGTVSLRPVKASSELNWNASTLCFSTAPSCLQLQSLQVVDEVSQSDLSLQHISPIIDSSHCFCRSNIKRTSVKTSQMDVICTIIHRNQRTHSRLSLGRTSLLIWKWLASSLKASPCTARLPGSKPDRPHYDFYFDFLQICSIPSGPIKSQLRYNGLSSGIYFGSTNQINSELWDH